jgi:hypothetical protein
MLIFFMEFSFGQRGYLEFGNVPMADLTSTRCDIDSSASAVILFDEVKAELTNLYRYRRHTRIKFFRTEAVAAWANVNLVYFRDRQTVSKIKAATYNLVNGQVVTTEFDNDNLYRTKIDKRFSKLSFALPKVTAGSVVEFSYTITSNGNFRMANVLGALFGVNSVDLSWQFQHSIPMYWGHYEYEGSYAASYIQSNFPVEESKESGKGISKSGWTVKNVPAFHEEPYSISKTDLVGKVYVDLYEKTWSQIGSFFSTMKEYGLTERDSSTVRQLSARFKTIPDARVRIDSVVRFVKRKLKWNNEVDLSPDRKFTEVFISGFGSSSEINLVIMALLKRTGLSCFPFLISTRDHGMISAARPRASQLNDVMVSIFIPKTNERKEEFVFVDGTDRLLPSEFIPLRCLNNDGLLMDGRNSRLMLIATPRSKSSIDATFRIDEVSKELGGEIKLSFYGVNASEERNLFQTLGKERYEEKLSVRYPSKADPALVKNVDKADSPFTVLFTAKSSEGSRFSNDLIYLNPFFLYKQELNHFTSERRISPVDINPPQERIFVATIEVPEKYSVDELPKPGAFSLPNASGKFLYNVTQRNNTIHIIFQLQLTKVLYSPEEYYSLQEFYNIMISKQAEPIVLRKK